MIYCLNPDCTNPLNPDNHQHCQTCGTPLSDLLDNRYKVIEPLGRGGFGTTYLAEDTRTFNERCVVKQLTYRAGGTQATQKAMQLFEQEAKQLKQLNHPYIPRLLAYLQENNYFYLVQEFIKGQDLLKELNSQGTFNETQIQELLFDILPILEYIHGLGVVHRDIKPENIMRRQSDGQLVLIDFGVSKLLAQTGTVQTGTRVGSPGYAPLEQMQLGRVTAASDLFSLGTTCFHLLTQIVPNELWIEYGYSWVDNWQSYLRSPLSPNVSHVLGTLLQKNLQHRCPSASTALRELQTQTLPTIPVSQFQNIAPTQAVPLQVRSSSPPHGTVIQKDLPPEAITSRPTRRVGWNFGFRWAIANYLNVLASTIIIVIPVILIVAITPISLTHIVQVMDIDSVSKALAILILIPIWGMGRGLAEWFVLKKWVPRIAWWIPATACAVTLAAASREMGFLGGTLGGVIAGTVLWFVIRQQTSSRAKWLIPYWAISNAMSAIAPSLAAYKGGGDIVNTGSDYLETADYVYNMFAAGSYDSLEGVVSGLVWGIILGVPLNASLMTWILRR
ncbi:MAG: serine/threonine-protein kinase [Cyanobacteria bacterium J06592_8]